MAAWVFMSMAGFISFILAEIDERDLIFPHGGWSNLKIHAKNREWKTSTPSTCAVPSISCPKINIFKCCRQPKKRQYVPTISEEVSNQLKTEINSLKTDKQNLQKAIQSLERQNQTTQKNNKTLTLELGESKATVDVERKRVQDLRDEAEELREKTENLREENENLRDEAEDLREKVQVTTEKAVKNETENKKIIIIRDILLERLDDFQQKLEDQEEKLKQKENEIEETKLECPTCLDNFEGIDHGMVVSKNCGHILGESCLRMELEKDAPRCPGCNRRFNEADIMRVYKL